MNVAAHSIAWTVLAATSALCPTRLAAEEGKSASSAKEETQAQPSLATIEKVDDLFEAFKATKAKMVLLNIWSSSCGGCLAEIPVLVALSKSDLRNNKEVALLGLSLDGTIFDKPEALKKATEVVVEKGLPYKNLVWTGELDPLMEKFRFETTPYNGLFTPDGKLLIAFTLPEDPAKATESIKSKIQETLAKLKAAESKSASEAPANEIKK